MFCYLECTGPHLIEWMRFFDTINMKLVKTFIESMVTFMRAQYACAATILYINNNEQAEKKLVALKR